MKTDPLVRPGHGDDGGGPRALEPQRADVIVHTEKDEVCNIYPVSETERPMAYQGFKADRVTLQLKYHCPAVPLIPISE